MFPVINQVPVDSSNWTTFFSRNDGEGLQYLWVHKNLICVLIFIGSTSHNHFPIQDSCSQASQTPRGRHYTHSMQLNIFLNKTILITIKQSHHCRHLKWPLDRLKLCDQQGIQAQNKRLVISMMMMWLIITLENLPVLSTAWLTANTTR